MNQASLKTTNTMKTINKERGIFQKDQVMAHTSIHHS